MFQVTQIMLIKKEQTMKNFSKILVACLRWFINQKNIIVHCIKNMHNNLRERFVSAKRISW